MSTLKQENIYNKMIKYYNYIDELIDLSSDNEIMCDDDEFNVIQSLISNLEDSADELSEEFINFVKHMDTDTTKTLILVALDSIIASIHNAKNEMDRIMVRRKMN